MRFIHLLLLLIRGFTPAEFDRSHDIEVGYNNFIDNIKRNPDSKFKKVLELDQNWLVMIIFAFIYPFVKRSIDQILNPDNSLESIKAKFLKDLENE